MSRLRVALGGALSAAMALGTTVTASPALAAARATPGRDAAVDVNPDQTNPCTGAVGDLVDDERDAWTAVTRSDGSTLVRGHSVSRVTFEPYQPSAASYAGEETFSDVETVSRGADTVHITQRLRMHGDDGGTLSLAEVIRVVVGPDDMVRVDIESFSLNCEEPA